MSLFQKMLLGKYTKPCKDEDQRASHSHQVITEAPHSGGDKPGLGVWLAQKLPAQALREFGSTKYDPPTGVSSDAISLLHPELVDSQAPVTGDVQEPLAWQTDEVAPFSGERKRYRSEEQQWQLETRIARLKAAHRRSA